MGRLDRIKQVQQESNDGIWTIELNEGNVEKIFNICLAKGQEPFHNIQVLGPGIAKKASDIFQVSIQKVKDHDQVIQYLLGQIKKFHIFENTDNIRIQDGFFRYDGITWTKDYDIMFKLYSLGLAGGFIRGFVRTKSDIVSLLYPNRCIPTLSPKDPNFPAWWEAHKSEWETEQ